jgi:hypothetical protein
MRLVTVAALLGVIGCTLPVVPPPPPPAAFETNASFLTGHFLFDAGPQTASARITDDWAARSISSYRAPIWLPQAGTIDPNNAGLLVKGPTSAVTFLNHVAAYETAHGQSFTLLAVLNGDATKLDLGDPTVQANIVADCGQFLSATVPGSYVAGAARTFDGCALDIEPAGDPVVYANLKAIVIALRASAPFSGGGKRIGIAAPSLHNPKPASGWLWNSSDYYYMGEYVDYILAMTYDTRLTSTTSYQTWIAAQTDSILQAVSGARWNYDANHPQEASGVHVLLGIPGYSTTTVNHDPRVENVRSAAQGIFAGVNALQAADAISPTYLLGAFMFQHDGGLSTFTTSTGTVIASPFALYTADWVWWRQYWLGENVPAS